jgi:hypothetical protein
MFDAVLVLKVTGFEGAPVPLALAAVVVPTVNVDGAKLMGPML